MSVFQLKERSMSGEKAEDVSDEHKPVEAQMRKMVYVCLEDHK